VKNSHEWLPRLIAGLGGLVLMLGMLTVIQYGVPRVPGVLRPADTARIRTVALRTSGTSVSRGAATSNVEAGSQQFCYYKGGYACLNAWGGGPWVNAYTGGFETRDNNEYFNVIVNYATGDSELEFTGGGTWDGKCIGDAYDNSGYADTSLDSCGNNGEGAGWGTNFIVGTSGCAAGSEWFYNTNWDGYLGPPNGWTNGSHFYLNNKGYACFKYSLYVN
jgi:hypothetical protein